MAKEHIVTGTCEALCGTQSFIAVATAARNGCVRCAKRLETLLYVIDQLAHLPGMSELYAKDLKVRSVIDALPQLYGVLQKNDSSEPSEEVKAQGCVSTPDEG